MSLSMSIFTKLVWEHPIGRRAVGEPGLRASEATLRDASRATTSELELVQSVAHFIHDPNQLPF